MATRARETRERPMTDTEYIEYLEKELKLTKEDFLIKLEQQQDQFLKVVESVLKEHPISHSEVYVDYIMHKIKSAIEKGNCIEINLKELKNEIK